MNPFNRTFEGYGEIIVASILWSFAGILAKMISDMSAHSIIFYRTAFASIIFFIILLISGNLKIIKLGEKKFYLIVFGTMQAVTMLAYFVSILNASVSIAVLLLYTAPVYVTLLSPWLLKESPTKKGTIALALSIAGIMFIVEPWNSTFTPEGWKAYSIGMLAGILSGITYAFQILTSKYISKTYSGYAQAFWSAVITMVILLPIGTMPVEVVFKNIYPLILLAIFPTILAVSLYFSGLKKVRASSASILGLIEPLSAVILAFVILNETISTLEILGGALILTGAALVTRDERWYSRALSSGRGNSLKSKKRS